MENSIFGPIKIGNTLTSKIDFKTHMINVWSTVAEARQMQEYWNNNMQQAQQQLAGIAENESHLSTALQELIKENTIRFINLSNRSKEKILSTLDFSSSTEPNQRALIDLLKQGTYYRYLTFKNSYKKLLSMHLRY